MARRRQLGAELDLINPAWRKNGVVDAADGHASSAPTSIATPGARTGASNPEVSRCLRA